MFDTWSKENRVDTEHLLSTEDHVEPFEGKVGDIYVEKAGIRVEAREVDFIASTADIDGDGDIVEQDFVFERFNKNPVVLFAHDSRSLPIGQAINTRTEGGVLRTTVKFASKAANPIAENVFQLVKEGVMRAMSIGFLPRDIRREVRDEKEVFILSKNELFEVSVVPIPSNPNALAEAKSKALNASKKSHLTPPLGQDKKPTNGGTGEVSMDEKEFAALTKAHSELDEKHIGLKKEHDALKERYHSLEGLYNSEKQRANDAELSVVSRDLDELVGKKIAPTEKVSLLKLAAANRELYEEQVTAIKERPNMSLTVPSVIPPTGAAPLQLPAPDGAGSTKSGEDFANLVLRQAGLSR